MAEQGIEQFSYDLSNSNNTNFQLAAEDQEQEFQQLIHWLKERLNHGDENIAVVIPDLQQYSIQFNRKLKRYFSSEQFNISLGQTLNEYPLVAHGLKWLSLSTEDILHEQAQLLLHSPYLKGAQTELHG